MKNQRRFAALLSGLVLYCAVIALSEMLAGLQLPSPLYRLLGGHGNAVLIAGQAGLIALLMFVLTLPWGYATILLARLSRGSSTAWCLGGVLAGWVAWVIYGSASFALNPISTDMPISSWLLSSLMPPLWGVLNIIAVLGATWLAGRLVQRIHPAPPSRRRSSGKTQAR